VLPNFSPRAQTLQEMHLPQTQAIRPLLRLASSAAKHPVISNGQSLTQASYLPSTSFHSPLRTLPISLSSRCLSLTLTPLSGACFTLHMLVIIYPRRGLNSARSRRTLPAPMGVEQELALPGKPPRRRLYGRRLERATRTVWNGSYYVLLSISSTTKS
jgi:hypothetical protein